MGDAERSGMADAAAMGLQGQARTRLQSLAPASLDIKRPLLNWNAEIPLLSPIVSPSSCGNSGADEGLLMAESKGREGGRQRGANAKGVTFTKWQHPAAPFYYGPVPRAPFVPV